MKNLFNQNLNEGGSMLWHGRARWYSKYEPFCEWVFGRRANTFHAKLWFGHGEGGSGVMFSFGIPWLFSLYLGVDGVFRCKECYTGIAIHDSAVWLYPLPYAMESNRRDPWYRHCYCLNFPWGLNWWSTEVLAHEANIPHKATVVWRETRKSRRGQDTFDVMREQTEFAGMVSRDYPYTYKLKCGDTQERTATVHVTRMTWRARWWPIINRKQIRTTIDVKFSDEVGEGSGSWKGGCTGCGYEMLHGETPLQTLRRMERERVFKR